MAERFVRHLLPALLGILAGLVAAGVLLVAFVWARGAR